MTKTKDISIINNTMRLRGNLQSNANIRFNGQLEGNLKSTGAVTMSKEARIKGDVHAAELVVDGQIEGNIIVENEAVFGNTAKINGNIQARQLSINTGAIFNGQCDLLDKSK